MFLIKVVGMVALLVVSITIGILLLGAVIERQEKNKEISENPSIPKGDYKYELIAVDDLGNPIDQPMLVIPELSGYLSALGSNPDEPVKDKPKKKSKKKSRKKPKKRK